MSEEKFVYGILSYKRAKKQPTLDYLHNAGVPKDKIYIFVQTKEDYNAYQRYSKYANIKYAPASCCAQARNNVLNGINGCVLMLDDDIRKISRLVAGKLQGIVDREELAKLFNACFAKTQKLGAKFFGVYPIHNDFFMQKTISTKVAINTLFGFIGREMFDASFDTKEDAELCGRVLSRGDKIVRFNFIAVDADHRKNKDGYIDDWHQEENLRCVKMLCERYPEIFVPQKNKPWEVRSLVKDEKIILKGAEESKKNAVKLKNKIDIKQNYPSPRWSGELADCSMPLTFDTYSNCSFGCLYCFSQFQRALSCNAKDRYLSKGVTSVNPERVKAIFLEGKEPCFDQYIADRKVMQWGGLSDQFDGFERQYGVTLELMKFFKEINYPLCFSTKSTWWMHDERYTSLVQGQKNWNCKFSIITNDADVASKIEVGVPSPQERLEAIRIYSELDAGGATLRLRPFIIGATSKNYLELIEQAYDAGARAVTTEFLCLENRVTPLALEHYAKMSEVLGFDLLEFYRKYSESTGYLRLNRKIKEPYIRKMQALCAKLGMRFYVSDAHFKEACDGSCCCGLPEEFNYSRGNFSYALQLCRKNGSVRFSEIADKMEFLKDTPYVNGAGFNTCSAEKRAKFRWMNFFDYMRYLWNNPNNGQSPCKMFGKVMMPDGYDENGDVIYRYNKDVTYVR